MSPLGEENNLNEGSPLLSPQEEDFRDGAAQQSQVLSEQLTLDDEADMKSKPWWYLLLLTISLLGLQIVWSVELGSGSPFLLSLGMSKSVLAFVWIAGPLTGVLVQPYMGIRSDNCRIRWGRRKPFMVGGAIATVISLLGLAWAREVIGGIAHLFGGDRASHGVKIGAMVFATIWMYVLDFSINTGMFPPAFLVMLC